MMSKEVPEIEANLNEREYRQVRVNLAVNTMMSFPDILRSAFSATSVFRLFPLFDPAIPSRLARDYLLSRRQRIAALLRRENQQFPTLEGANPS